jgi:hypothetical protein
MKLFLVMSENPLDAARACTLFGAFPPEDFRFFAPFLGTRKTLIAPQLTAMRQPARMNSLFCPDLPRKFRLRGQAHGAFLLGFLGGIPASPVPAWPPFLVWFLPQSASLARTRARLDCKNSFPARKRGFLIVLPLVAMALTQVAISPRKCPHGARPDVRPISGFFRRSGRPNLSQPYL